MPRIAGVDGCRGGWIVVKMDTNNNAIEHGLCVNFQEVIQCTQDCDRVAVDIPIGLPNDANGRICDQEARDFLQQNHGTWQSVFTAPALGIVQQINYNSMQELIELHAIISANYRQTYNRGITIQAVCLFNKLHEVNIQYASQINQRQNIKEFHPELVWAARSNGANLEKKKTPQGQQQRIEILNLDFNIDMDFIVAIRRDCGCANVAKDDIIDAMGGLLAAQDMIQNRNCIAPAQASANGLNMEIWY